MKTYKTTMQETIQAFVNSEAFSDKVRKIVRDEISNLKLDNKPTTAKKPSAKSKPTATVIKQPREYQHINFANTSIKVYTTVGKSGKQDSVLRINFAERPLAKVINLLKSVGYGYHSETKTWFAHNTDATVSIARQVYKLCK